MWRMKNKLPSYDNRCDTERGELPMSHLYCMLYIMLRQVKHKVPFLERERAFERLECGGAKKPSCTKKDSPEGFDDNQDRSCNQQGKIS